jgi:hypothetical protein
MLLLNGGPIEPGVQPQPVGECHRVDAGGLPPCHLIAAPVKGPMVGAAQRHRELIADPAPQGHRLHAGGAAASMVPWPALSIHTNARRHAALTSWSMGGVDAITGAVGGISLGEVGTFLTWGNDPESFPDDGR